MKKKKSKSRYVDNDKREESAINKVRKSAKVDKGSAIAILKSNGVLKQKGKGLNIKRGKK